jgi:hypothetical protein
MTRARFAQSGLAEAITSPTLRSVSSARSGRMCSRIQGAPTSRAMRSASSAVENSRIRIRCMSSTFATRAASAPASTTSCIPSRAASTVASGTGSRRRRWLTTTCVGRSYRVQRVLARDCGTLAQPNEAGLGSARDAAAAAVRRTNQLKLSTVRNRPAASESVLDMRTSPPGLLPDDLRFALAEHHRVV